MTAKKEQASDESAKEKLDGETKSNVLKITRMEEAEKAKRTNGEKISELIADFCGSMTFVYVHIVWFGGWIILNSSVFRFDPFPYTFLTLMVSLEAIFLSTFILISQNHETRLAERRNHLDLQVNMLAEQENSKLLELVRLVAKKVGVQSEDEEIMTLMEPVEPDKLLKQIMSATGDE